MSHILSEQGKVHGRVYCKYLRRWSPATLMKLNSCTSHNFAECFSKFPILFYTDFSLECFKIFSIFKNLQSYLIVLVSQPSMFRIKRWKQWARYLKHTAKTRRGYFSRFYYFFLRTISQKVNNRNTRKRCKMCLKLTI